MFGGADRYKKLAWKCVDMDKAFHTYFSGTGKIFVMNSYKFSNFIYKLHIFANTFSIFLYSCTSKLTEAQNNPMHKHKIFNHVDTFFDIAKCFRKELLECQTTQPCRSRKEALEWRVLNVFGWAQWMFLVDSIKVIKHVINIYYIIYTFVPIYIFNDPHSRRTWISNLFTWKNRVHFCAIYKIWRYMYRKFKTCNY